MVGKSLVIRCRRSDYPVVGGVRLPGDLSYWQTNSNIVLDRTPPTYVSSDFSPRPHRMWPMLLSRSVRAIFLGRPSHRDVRQFSPRWINFRHLGIWKGAAETGNTVAFNWNMTGLEGIYQIAF